MSAMDSNSKRNNVAHAGRILRLVLGLLDFRERTVNHASFYYGAATTLAMLYVIQCWANGDPWAGAKGIAACIAGKLCQLRHPLKSPENVQADLPPNVQSASRQDASGG